MDTTAADVKRWARGLRAAHLRITHDAGTDTLGFADALARVDELRETADALGATVDPLRRHEENLAFHLTWAQVRRACGVG